MLSLIKFGISAALLGILVIGINWADSYAAIVFSLLGM